MRRPIGSHADNGNRAAVMRRSLSLRGGFAGAGELLGSGGEAAGQLLGSGSGYLVWP